MAGNSRSGNASHRRAKGHDDQIPNGSTSRRDIFPPLTSSMHPSLSAQYAGGANGVHKYDLSASHSNDWAGPPPHGQLEGPGVSVARNAHTGMSMGPLTPNIPLNSRDNQAASVAPDTATEAGEGDGEGDDRTYCVCDRVSYGEMIACDDANCEREWVRLSVEKMSSRLWSNYCCLQFHLACIGLTVPPEGTWFCEACRAKQRNAKRGARGNRKRVGGGGNGRSGRNANS